MGGFLRIVVAEVVGIVREWWRHAAVVAALAVLGGVLSLGVFVFCDLVIYPLIGDLAGLVFVLYLFFGIPAYVLACIYVWSRVADRMREMDREMDL